MRYLPVLLLVVACGDAGTDSHSPLPSSLPLTPPPPTPFAVGTYTLVDMMGYPADTVTTNSGREYYGWRTEQAPCTGGIRTSIVRDETILRLEADSSLHMTVHTATECVDPSGTTVTGDTGRSEEDGLFRLVGDSTLRVGIDGTTYWIKMLEIRDDRVGELQFDWVYPMVFRR